MFHCLFHCLNDCHFLPFSVFVKWGSVEVFRYFVNIFPPWLFIFEPVLSLSFLLSLLFLYTYILSYSYYEPYWCCYYYYYYFPSCQSNSEHSRHWFFGGRMVIDGEEKKETLFSMVKSTLPAVSNSVIAFHDNSSVCSSLFIAFYFVFKISDSLFIYSCVYLFVNLFLLLY